MLTVNTSSIHLILCLLRVKDDYGSPTDEVSVIYASANCLLVCYAFPEFRSE